MYFANPYARYLRLFKFPQMDFELAVWEMTHLLIAPKKVFRSIYYHKQTKNTYHRGDPSFTYLLAFFMTLTGIAWGVGTAPGVGGVIRLTLIYVFVHLIMLSLVVATLEYFLVSRFLGKRGLLGVVYSHSWVGTATRKIWSSDTHSMLQSGLSSPCGFYSTCCSSFSGRSYPRSTCMMAPQPLLNLRWEA